MLPSEPTGEMLKAGALKYLEIYSGGKDFVVSPHHLHLVGQIWKAMATASPVHPSDNGIGAARQD
jgi:hypothetical protein